MGGSNGLGNSRQQIIPKSFMNITERGFGLHSGWALEGVLWTSLGQEEGLINGGKGKLLLDLHQGSHTD